MHSHLCMCDTHISRTTCVPVRNASFRFSFMSSKYMFGLLSLLGNKHFGWGAEAASSLFPGPVWAEHIPEPKRSYVSMHTWAATLKSLQRKLWAGMFLGSPIPSLQQPLGTSQLIRGAAWLIKLEETSHSLSKAYKPILWVCIQILSEC